MWVIPVCAGRVVHRFTVTLECQLVLVVELGAQGELVRQAKGAIQLCPGAVYRAPDFVLIPDAVADAVLLALERSPGTVLDEINLSPQKKVIEFNKK